MLANFQFQVHVQLAAGKVLLVVDLCVGSPTSLAQYAHAHFHPSTTLLPSRDFPIQALLFPNFTSISFFIPPINTVFYLIERIIQYFILLNDCDKEQKKESLCRGYILQASLLAKSGLESRLLLHMLSSTSHRDYCTNNVFRKVKNCRQNSINKNLKISSVSSARILYNESTNVCSSVSSSQSYGNFYQGPEGSSGRIHSLPHSQCMSHSS